MSEIGRRAGAPSSNRIDPGAALPTGTVTLLLADVEGSARLWEARPEQMAAAMARLDRRLAEVVAAYGGARPVVRGGRGDFLVAFTRASDALACALELQRAPLAPVRLCIGLHTGERQLPGDTDYVDATANRAARLRDLAHGGQTVLSGLTRWLVADRLPAGAWLTELGSYRLCGVLEPERVAQLCHPDLGNEFPPLRTQEPAAGCGLPVQPTRFIGRRAELAAVRRLVGEHRLVTLTGPDGVGKTRLAAQLAGESTDAFGGGAFWVDLATVVDTDLLTGRVARMLSLSGQPDRCSNNTLTRLIGDREMLLVLDGCEHLLGACAALVATLLGSCPGLKVVATNLEPLGVDGEVIWRTPSLVADEAVELFTDRARLARPGFAVTGDNAVAVAQICRRLDGVALAIELAAARVRALPLDEIVDGLHDRFRLLAGGANAAVPRQQTLRTSIDWSHMLLGASERVVFRRLAVFRGAFDIDAAHAVTGGGQLQRYQVLDQLALLVGKSLVVADAACGLARYRLLEPLRCYALERLGEAGEIDAVRDRHRDHYSGPFDTPTPERTEKAPVAAEERRPAPVTRGSRGQ